LGFAEDGVIGWLALWGLHAQKSLSMACRGGGLICHARGLPQGDPLSPMIFVIVMEVLNRMLLWVEQHGHLSEVQGLQDRRVSLYADHLVLFVTPDERSLHAVQPVLSIFGHALGLYANVEKRIVTPINCSDHHMQVVL